MSRSFPPLKSRGSSTPVLYSRNIPECQLRARTVLRPTSCQVVVFPMQPQKDEGLQRWKERSTRAQREFRKEQGKFGRVLGGSCKASMCRKGGSGQLFKNVNNYILVAPWNLGVALWCTGKNKFIFKLHVGCALKVEEDRSRNVYSLGLAVRNPGITRTTNHVSISEFQAPGGTLANLFSVPYLLKKIFCLTFPICLLANPAQIQNKRMELGSGDGHFPRKT